MKDRLEIRGVKLKGVPVYGIMFLENGAFVAMCFSTDQVAGHFEGFGKKEPALQPDMSGLSAAERARTMLAHIAYMNNWTAFYEHVLGLEEQVRARLATGNISVDPDNAVSVLWARDEDLAMWKSLLEDWELPQVAAKTSSVPQLFPSKPLIGVPAGPPRYQSDIVLADVAAHTEAIRADIQPESGADADELLESADIEEVDDATAKT